MNVDVDIDVNDYIYDWLEKQGKERYVLLYGGSSAGKSYTLKQFVAIDKLITETNKVWYILRKTNPALKRSVYKLLLEQLDLLGIEYEHNKTDQVIKIPATNTEVYFTSLDDPEKIKSVECNYIWLEEATEFSESDFKRCKIAIRRQSHDKRKNQIYLTFNPTSIDSWVYKVFWKQQEQAAILKCTYKENPFLTQDDIDTLENEKDEYYYNVYCLGNFGVLDNTNCVIPANFVHRSLDNKIDLTGGLDIGVDVARFGDDEAVIYFKVGGCVYKPVTLEKSRTTDITAAVINVINEYGTGRRIKINVDVTGVGSGVVDELYLKYNRNQDVTVNEINFGGSAKQKDRYGNVATEMYYDVKSILENGNIKMYNDDITINQLSTRTFTIDNKSRLILTSKDKHKKESGESPDRADAFCLMCYEVDRYEPSITEVGDRDEAEEEDEWD